MHGVGLGGGVEVEVDVGVGVGVGVGVAPIPQWAVGIVEDAPTHTSGAGGVSPEK